MRGFDKVVPGGGDVGGVGVVGGFVDYEADVVEAGGVGEAVVKLCRISQAFCYET